MNSQNSSSNTQHAYENNSKNLLDSIQQLTETETDLLTQVTNLAGVDTIATGVNTSDVNNPETNRLLIFRVKHTEIYSFHEQHFARFFLLLKNSFLSKSIRLKFLFSLILPPDL